MWALLFSLVLVLAAGVGEANAQVRIRVRGTAKLTAHASRDQGDLVFSGSLLDDANQRLAGESVSILIARESDPHDPKVVAGLRAARGCDNNTDRPQKAYAVHVTGPPDAPEVVAVTDEGGRFCFRARLVPDRHVAHVAWRGSSLVDAADTEIAFDLSRRALALNFDPTPNVVRLDNASSSFEVAAVVDDDSAHEAQRGIELALSNESGVDLGRVATDSAGRARFNVETSRLGAPGRGELRVAFAGSAEIAFATRVVPIERHVKVSLRAADVPSTAVSPEDGIPLLVDVGSVAGPVTEGGVEARIDDVVVGAAPVERGTARLLVTFAAAGPEARLMLRYVPAAPWFESLGETPIRIPTRGPGVWSKAPLVLAGLAVLAFFLVGRVASRGSKEAPSPAPKVDHEDMRPRLDVVRGETTDANGYGGRVIDVHDRVPVAGARIWIERGAFDGRTLLASATVAPDGSFRLPSVDASGGDVRIVAEAATHAQLVQPLPPPGILEIALESRRRAVLGKLVAWARRRGMPFDSKPEPTPGHVRRAAGEDFRTARWADAVERAAFGPNAVDAHVEDEIEKIAPDATVIPPPEPRRR